jgi:hypothetical protein
VLLIHVAKSPEPEPAKLEGLLEHQSFVTKPEQGFANNATTSLSKMSVLLQDSLFIQKPSAITASNFRKVVPHGAVFRERVNENTQTVRYRRVIF